MINNNRKLLFVLLLSIFLITGFCFNAYATINWKMATVWQRGTFLFEGDQRFVDKVNKLAQGELEIKLYGVGELCSAPETFDLVRTGTVEAGGDWAGYWTGKNTAFDLLGSNCIGFTNWDYMIWIYARDGLDSYNEIYGKYNMLYFPTMGWSMESGISSKRPIKRIEDLKGLKIRMAGLIQGKVFEELGITPVSIATTELYEALLRGVIDGAEYSGPTNNLIFNIHEVTDYWLAPGWHQTSSLHGAMINKDAWEKLPEHLQNIISVASKSAYLESTALVANSDAGATEKILSYGVKINRLPKEDIVLLEKVKNKVQEDLAASNPDYAKVLKSQLDFYRYYASYREMLDQWSFGRTPTEYPNIP